MHPLAEKYLRKSSLPTLFCPGCGHGTVLNCFIRAIDELGIIDDVGLVSGIGCSSWVPVFVNADVLHTLHGRAVAVATGLKLANPKLHVVVFTGDGDCLGIGGNHFIHAARRNIDMTVIMLNNYIYGMTGGQLAPTTPTDSRTQTSPYGNPEPPVDACKLAVASGATYVARWTTAQPAALVKALKEAIRHRGFSFIDTISQCPTQAGRYIFANDDPTKLLEVLKTRKISCAQAAKLPEKELQDRIVTGKLFEDNQKQEFVAKIYSLMETAKG